ncbi:abortive infection family protein [Pseudonocardia alni]|uniref:abortive infection family protein n=1 Tax=Pseudonocardia alni TaxID=33907 RepID=UPI003712D2A7
MASTRRELMSAATRGAFRDLMTGSTLSQIGRAFQDEGFAPTADGTYEDSSERRTLTQEYMDAVDWGDAAHVARVLRVFEQLLDGFEVPYTDRFFRALRRDGYQVADDGEIVGRGPDLTAGSLAGVRDPVAIHEQLDRIRRAFRDDDPALVVGSAKELIESTAKCVLLERGLPVDDKADLPALVKDAQQALGLHPSVARAGPDGNDAVKRILGGAASIALGVGELRNRVGTGHGATGVRVGLRPRHARLAVNAATTWCELMLDTLADPDAPWRHQDT